VGRGSVLLNGRSIVVNSMMSMWIGEVANFITICTFQGKNLIFMLSVRYAAVDKKELPNGQLRAESHVFKTSVLDGAIGTALLLIHLRHSNTYES
jgi:hypothetical protein